MFKQDVFNQQNDNSHCLKPPSSGAVVGGMATANLEAKQAKSRQCCSHDDMVTCFTQAEGLLHPGSGMHQILK
jgi:hypothetical protein